MCVRVHVCGVCVRVTTTPPSPNIHSTAVHKEAVTRARWAAVLGIQHGAAERASSMQSLAAMAVCVPLVLYLPVVDWWEGCVHSCCLPNSGSHVCTAVGLYTCQSYRTTSKTNVFSLACGIFKLHSLSGMQSLMTCSLTYTHTANPCILLLFPHLSRTCSLSLQLN